MPEPFCTMYEKRKFLSMGYISALTQASVFNMKQECSSVMYINFIAKDTSNISYTVRYGLGQKALSLPGN